MSRASISRAQQRIRKTRRIWQHPCSSDKFQPLFLIFFPQERQSCWLCKWSQKGFWGDAFQTFKWCPLGELKLGTHGCQLSLLSWNPDWARVIKAMCSQSSANMIWLGLSPGKYTLGLYGSLSEGLGKPGTLLTLTAVWSKRAKNLKFMRFFLLW